MKKKAKRREKKKSMFDLDAKELNEYLKQVPEVIFLLFMCWFGYSVIYGQTKNAMYQKYLKKSLIQGRKYIDSYFPGFLANENVFNIFDYDVLFIKTKEIINWFGGLYILGASMLLVFSSAGRKILLFLCLLLDLIFVHNLICYRDGNLIDILFIVFYLIVLIAL